MKKSIIKTMCACSLALVASACSEKQVNVDDDPTLTSMGFQGKTIVVKDAANDDNLVLKVYSRNEEALALCNEKNFTFVSDSFAVQKYDSEIIATAKEEEEIINDIEEAEGGDIEGFDSTYIVYVVQINIKKHSELGFRFEEDLPNPYANNEIKANICGDYKSMGYIANWPRLVKAARVTNKATGLCNGIKVRIWDKEHPYAWNPSVGYAHEDELRKYGESTDWYYASKDSTTSATMALCTAPRRDKNRSQVSCAFLY